MRRNSKKPVRLGPLSCPEDSKKCAALLESAYRRAKWRWIVSEVYRGEFPSASQIEMQIEQMRTDKDDYSTGGLTMVTENGERVLYVDSKLAGSGRRAMVSRRSTACRYASDTNQIALGGSTGMTTGGGGGGRLKNQANAANNARWKSTWDETARLDAIADAKEAVVKAAKEWKGQPVMGCRQLHDAIAKLEALEKSDA